MKNGPCDNCAYHRPQRSLEELLGFPLSPGINHALQMIRSVESDFVRAEIGNKRLLEEQRNDVWPSQPKVVAYCGRFEDQGIFHVCEVKNKGQQCVDFKESYSYLFFSVIPVSTKLKRRVPNTAHDKSPNGVASPATLREKIQRAQSEVPTIASNSKRTRRKHVTCTRP